MEPQHQHRPARCYYETCKSSNANDSLVHFATHDVPLSASMYITGPMLCGSQTTMRIVEIC